MKEQHAKKAEHHLAQAHEAHKVAMHHHKEAAKAMKHAHKDGRHMDVKEDKKLIKHMVKKSSMRKA